jgi:hypothetical protein
MESFTDELHKMDIPFDIQVKASDFVALMRQELAELNEHAK